MTLDGKVAIITGGNRGIGAATAKLFSQKGAKIIITYSSEKTKSEALQVVEGINAKAVKCDVTDRYQVGELIETAVGTYGSLDILVNNAGVMEAHSVDQLDENLVERNIKVNIEGPVLCTAAAIQHLKDSKGVIVNTSSIVGLSPSLVNDIYTATKHALVGLTRSWALKFGPKGVRVNAVAPGPVTTDLLSNVSEEMLNKMKALCPLGRLGKPEEIANAIYFLASDMASYINGQTLVIDGGRFMH